MLSTGIRGEGLLRRESNGNQSGHACHDYRYPASIAAQVRTTAFSGAYTLCYALDL